MSGLVADKLFDMSIVLSSLLLVNSISRRPSWLFPGYSGHHLPMDLLRDSLFYTHPTKNLSNGNYDKYKIRYRKLVVGGWETSYP